MAKKPPSPPEPPAGSEAPPAAPSLDGGLFGDAPVAAKPYVVLARKYRPQAFPDLIGQDAMVRTLRNAFATGRIAQGYMLTGVRGVGKTTTARILARGLNYRTPDLDRPTVDMPALGEHCAAIIGSRHPDVVEMDAASNTGVDNVREIIESARYKPISARMKVFIIDEVHMLSKGAFNALLKTLEEPPEHVKFIFATTEIRKVPVTVLSRCQRFDLRRVDVPVLSAHLKSIASQEGAVAHDEAIAMIARAAEGSVRDSLSILDQAIAMAGGEPVSAPLVRSMLGLSDRGRILDLLEALVSGDIATGLGLMAGLHGHGADPVQVLGDLSETVHQIARVKVVGRQTQSDVLSAEERRRIEALAGALSVPLLSRYWQMLQKGHEEAGRAGDALAAADMVLIRIAHTADLPSPDDLVRMLGGDRPERRTGAAGHPAEAAADRSSRPSAAMSSAPPAANPAPRSNQDTLPPVASYDDLAAFDPAGYEAHLASDPGFDSDFAEPGLFDPELAELADLEVGGDDAPATAPMLVNVTSFEDVVALAGRKRDGLLRVHLEENVSLVRFDAATGSIDLHLLADAPASLPNDLREKLNRWTGGKWIVMLSKAAGAPTLGSIRREREAKERAILEQHPAIQAVLDTFPGAKIAAIRKQTVTPRDDDATGTG